MKTSLVTGNYSFGKSALDEAVENLEKIPVRYSFYFFPDKRVLHSWVSTLSEITIEKNKFDQKST